MPPGRRSPSVPMRMRLRAPIAARSWSETGPATNASTAAPPAAARDRGAASLRRLLGSAFGVMLLSMPAPCRGGTEALLDPGRLLARRSLSDLQAGPDGRWVAWTVSEPPQGERHRRHIWVLDVETRAARQFTYSKKSEWAARWSPDGRRLAFVSDRGDSPQLYLMPSDGGEAEKVADEEVADEAPAWAPDGSRIAFIGKEKKSDLEKRREKEKNDAHVVDKDDKPGRLFITDPQARSTRPLTPPDWKVSELQWLPRGDRLLLLASDRPHGDRWSTRIVLVDARSGALTTLASPAGPIAGLQISPHR